MRTFGVAVSLVLLGLATSAARAGIVAAPGSDLAVSLVTYGPGSVYWERFGHDAIQIRDRVSGESVDFNYGVFDFDERGFFWNFARGVMHYMIDAEPSAADESSYVDDGRSVTIQRLALTPAQAASLRDYLLWNLQPQNVVYDYNYLTNNCATRVRDALDRALGGAIRAALVPRRATLTYRQEIVRLMSPQPWLMLPMDLGMGPMADQPLDAWQESFLPGVLARDLRTVKVPNGHGGFEPVVSGERHLAPNRLTPPPARPPNLAWPLGIAGFALSCAVALARRRAVNLYASIVTAYLAVAGFAGLVLLALWTLTLHQVAWYNANLLLFNPLAFMLPATVWRTRRTGTPRPLATAIVRAQLAAIVIAVALHALPGVVQQNQPWLWFAIPVWITVAWALRAGRTTRR